LISFFVFCFFGEKGNTDPFFLAKLFLKIKRQVAKFWV